MTTTIRKETKQYTVIIIATHADGEKNKICEVTIPKDGTTQILTTTKSFDTLFSITEQAGLAIQDAEKIFLQEGDFAQPQQH